MSLVQLNHVLVSGSEQLTEVDYPRRGRTNVHPRARWLVESKAMREWYWSQLPQPAEKVRGTQKHNHSTKQEQSRDPVVAHNPIPK